VLVELVWRALVDAPEANPPYTVFVHLVDSAGQPVGQSDRPPADGDRPTSGWRSGEVIVDRHLIAVAPSAASGPLVADVGLYDPETGERVHFADGSDHVRLPLAVTVP
jgi:hypothetical protein